MFVPVCNISGKIIKPNEDAWCCLVQVQESFIKRQKDIYYPTELILPVTPFFKAVINDGIVYPNKSHPFTNALLKNLVNQRKLSQQVIKSPRRGSSVNRSKITDDGSTGLKLNIFGERLVHYSTSTGARIVTTMLFIHDDIYNLMCTEGDKDIVLYNSIQDSIRRHSELYNELGNYSADIITASATKAALHMHINSRILQYHTDTLDLFCDLYPIYQVEINNLLLLLDNMSLLGLSFSVPTIRNLLELKRPDSVKLQKKLDQLILRE